jgi:hypothetical protein
MMSLSLLAVWMVAASRTCKLDSFEIMFCPRIDAYVLEMDLEHQYFTVEFVSAGFQVVATAYILRTFKNPLEILLILKFIRTCVNHHI